MIEHPYTNRLALESSPYLLQHAHNPVNWYPYGPEAFAEAARRDVPVFISVGYATCHWCHVMERESFEDLEIAAALNRDFVAIKVDREERPDVDAVYMTAVQLLSGGGGWPMTVFATPDGKPFFAATYLPARDGDRGSRAGFLGLVQRIGAAWRGERRDALLRDAQRLSEAVRKSGLHEAPENMPGEPALREAVRFLATRWDVEQGGLRGAPKFPQPSMYELLLRYARRAGDDDARRMVVEGLRKMAAGGIYDQISGGFHRYSTDAAWLVPHFEKMLYDNAQLASVMSSALQLDSEAGLEAPLRETLDYLLREMRHPDGGFYSATDADSEGVEGKFFVWTPDEMSEVLGDAASAVMAVYGVTRKGNFEGANILHRPRPWSTVAEALGLDVEVLRAEVEAAKAKLRDRRALRVAPLLDDKILGEWNALAVSGLARAGFVLDEPRYTRAAVEAGRFMLEHLRSDAGLERAWRGGRTSGRAVLEDYAYRLQAALDLFEATADGAWLDEALQLKDELLAHFLDREGGGFFATDARYEDLLVRDKPGYDGAQPSGNSEAALGLYRLAALTGDPELRAWADRTVLAFGQQLDNGAIQNPKMACALDWRLDAAKEIVLVAPDDEQARPLMAVLRKTYVPNAVRLVVRPEQVEELQARIPWLEGKVALEGQATAYVCIEGACKLPARDPETLRAMLAPEVALDAPPLKFRKL